MKVWWILLFFLLSFSCCYEDKGNYDYTDIFEIQIDSIKESYSLYTLTDTLRIEPVISPAEASYDFQWCIYSTDILGYESALDTLDITTSNLVLPMTLDPGNYRIVFMAKEKNTGITKITDAALAVTTSLSEGWYVLRSWNGYTDLDLFSTKLGKLENIIATNNKGRQLKGEARGVDYNTEYKVWSEPDELYVNTKALFALSDQDALTMGTSNGVIIRDIDELFFEKPAVINPCDIYINGVDCFFVNDGKMHIINGLNRNSGRFGNAARGEYYLSPFRTFGWSNSLNFDEKSCSFVAVYVGDATIEKFSEQDTKAYPPVNNLDADLLYMGTGPRYVGWALLKKKQEDLWLMYSLNANKAQPPFAYPVNKCDTLDGSLKLLQAEFRASSMSNNIIYFAKGNVLYSCNIDAGYIEKRQAVINTGEKITYMRYMWYYTGDNDSFNKLAVATFDGNKYKIYLYDIQAGNLQPDPQVLEGIGEVGALLYINGNTKTILY